MATSQGGRNTDVAVPAPGSFHIAVPLDGYSGRSLEDAEDEFQKRVSKIRLIDAARTMATSLDFNSHRANIMHEAATVTQILLG